MFIQNFTKMGGIYEIGVFSTMMGQAISSPIEFRHRNSSTRLTNWPSIAIDYLAFGRTRVRILAQRSDILRFLVLSLASLT
jgi:hypothetical protein